MAKVYSLTKVDQLKDRKIFFDANVIIYNFWPTNSRYESSYSSAFGALLKQKNELFVNYIVISEVVNRAARIEYDSHLERTGVAKKDLNFKKYRNCNEGKEAFNDIYSTVKNQILPWFKVHGRAFEKADILSYLNVDSLDFSDKAILTVCKENDFVLLTNDSDFKGCSVDILTSHNRLLGQNR
jgi:predicted nucleic acid-binding protein